MRTAAVFLAFAAALVAAQDSKKSPVKEFGITAGDVGGADRGAWCKGERNTCNSLCPGRPKENKCDIETLEYICTCSNGTEPGLKYYDSSVYSKVCQEAFRLCTEQNAGDPEELPKCKDDIQSKCGTLSVSKLPDQDEESSGDDKSGDDKSGDDKSDDDKSGDEKSGSDEDEEDGGDDEGGSAGLRPVWGTAAVGAAIGAMAYLL